MAFTGADALLLISIDAVGRRIELHSNAIAVEVAGVKHVVYLDAAPDLSPWFSCPSMLLPRRVCVTGRCRLTALRNNWYFENLLEFQASVIATQQWLTLAGGAGRPRLPARSRPGRGCRVILQASTTSIGSRRTLTLNGATAITVEAMADELAQAIGRAIQVTALELKSPSCAHKGRSARLCGRHVRHP